MDTIDRLRRGWWTLAAAGTLALLLGACAAEQPPRAQTESITGDTTAPGAGQPGGAQPTPGTQPVREPAATAAGGAGRTRGTPARPGQLLEIGDWAVAVQATDTDAGDVIQAENQFNRPPPAGRTFALARVDLRYEGEGSGQAWLELGFQVLTPDGNTYGGYPDNCGVIPDDLLQIGEMFTGAAASGNVCVAVPAAQVDGAMWVVDERFSFGDGTRVFVAFQ